MKVKSGPIEEGDCSGLGRSLSRKKASAKEMLMREKSTKKR